MQTRGRPFWTMSPDEAFDALASRPEGLSTAEADLRLARDGGNLIETSVRRSILVKVGRRLAEPLTAILLISAGFSGAAGDWQSFVIILLIVAMSIVLDVFQEHKAENAIEALKRSVAVTARVRRDGAFRELPVKDIVRGDVVELKAGDLVPADGIILLSRAALANEASLTGEPYPVEKSTGVSRSSMPAEAQNALFAGTS